MTIFVRLAVSFLCLLFSLNAFAQKIEKGYFAFPIQPKQDNSLSATMGEIRPNHFHAGLDVRVGGVEGWPIYAAADGYVSRLNVNAKGYGLAVYITHPSGHTTLHGHLQKFTDKMQDYIVKMQYEKKAYEVELYPPDTLFKVKKGEIIGYAGNSGSSFGPHLHWEIRDTTESALNPLECRFSEIKDSRRPYFTKIVMKTFSTDARLNGQFGRFVFTPTGSAGSYSLPAVYALGEIGIEFEAFDKLDAAENKAGVPEYQLFVNNEERFYCNINRVPFEYSRMMNSHIDYVEYEKNESEYSKCYRAPGNLLPIYKSDDRLGKIYVKKGDTLKLRLLIKDTYGNSAELKFTVYGEDKLTSIKIPTSETPLFQTFENVLYFRALGKNMKAPALLHKAQGADTLYPSFTHSGYVFYLYDQRKGLLDAVEMAGKKELLQQAFAIGTGEQEIENQYFKAKFTKAHVQDTVYAKFSYADGVWTLGSYDEPVFSRYQLTLKRPKAADTAKYHVYSLTKKGGHVFEGGSWADSTSITCKPRQFGRFVIKKDDVGPTLSLYKKTSTYITVLAKDALSGLESCWATIDGQWLLLEYQKKTKSYVSQRLDTKKPLKGELIVYARDKAGNVSVVKSKI